MCAGGLRTHLTEADTVKGVEALRSWGVRDAQYREIVLAPLRTAIEVPAHTWYAEMMKALGYHDVKATAIRKRNSNKQLYEYAVTATK